MHHALGKRGCRVYTVSLRRVEVIGVKRQAGTKRQKPMEAPISELLSAAAILAS